GGRGRRFDGGDRQRLGRRTARRGRPSRPPAPPDSRRPLRPHPPPRPGALPGRAPGRPSVSRPRPLRPHRPRPQPGALPGGAGARLPPPAARLTGTPPSSPRRRTACCRGNASGMSPEATPFFVTGGTLAPDAPSYVERRADRDLYQGLKNGEFCYV